MDIAELLEAERIKEAAAEEERMRMRAEYQLKALTNEKHKYISRTNYEIKRTQISLRFLEVEKDLEIDNFLATQSDSIENTYRQQEEVVKDLVRTKDIVKSILASEKKANADLEKKIQALERDEMAVKKDHSEKLKKHLQFRIPDKSRMNDRVEKAASRFNHQLAKNRALEDKIDELVFVRKCCHSEVIRLEGQIEHINMEVAVTMGEIAELSETRERIENTQVKVRDHLTKVRDRYQRELLNLALSISDSRETEAFMKTKHKDITQYLIHQREVALEKVRQMLSQTDQFQRAFNAIRQTTGEEDMFKVVDQFLEAEDNNFATFLKINEVMSKNEALKNQMADTLRENVEMENNTIDFMTERTKTIKETEAQIDMYKQKSEACLNRLADTGKELDEYIGHIQTILKILKIPASELRDAVGPSGQFADTSILPCMTLVEAGVSVLLQDYYLMELAVRSKTNKSHDKTEDEKMLTRVPSERIVSDMAPVASGTTTTDSVKSKDDLAFLRHQPGLMGVAEMKELVVKEMLHSPRGSAPSSD